MEPRSEHQGRKLSWDEKRALGVGGANLGLAAGGHAVARSGDRRMLRAAAHTSDALQAVDARFARHVQRAAGGGTGQAMAIGGRTARGVGLIGAGLLGGAVGLNRLMQSSARKRRAKSNWPGPVAERADGSG